MIGIGCVFRNTEVYEDVKDAILYLSEQLIAADKVPSVGRIFNQLRAMGVEIDLQTVGHAYNAVSDKTDQRYMTPEEVDEYILANYERAIDRASKLHVVDKETELGRDKQELAVVQSILNMFFQANTTVNETKSLHRQMQDALWKEIQRKLNIPNKPRPATMTDWQDVLTQALGYDKMGITDLAGKLNSMADLYDGMQAQLEDASQRLGVAADPAVMARWDAALSALRGKSYALLLSKSEANTVLMGLLKEAGLAKEVTINGQTRLVKDWTKLAGEIGTVDDLRASVQMVMQAAGYDQRSIDAVKRALEDEFLDLREAVIRKQIEQEERIAREGTKNTLDDAGLQTYLNGQTPQQWIKTEDIENLEDLERKAETLLATKQYIPAVRQRIIDRLKDFFDRNYAKVVSREAREAIRDIVGGLTPLEWILENGLQNQQDLRDYLNMALLGRNISPQHQQEIMAEFDRILDLNNRAKRNLESREKSLGRAVQTKTDIRRLAELYNLGLFDTGQHKAVLYNLMGVDDLSVQDMEDIEKLAKTATELFQWMQRNDMTDQVFATREFQYLQRHIDRIVARNVNNKTKLLKILAGLRAFFDLFLSGLLSGPFTIAENMWSGIKVGLASLKAGGGQVSKEDMQVYTDMLKDVTRTGQPYGEEIGAFAPRELYSNMLAWKWRGGTTAEKAQSLLYLMHFPGRVGLLGFDSANKVFATNQIFKHAIYQALVGHGIDKVSARNFMNTALNGQSFEAAKKQAEEVINMVNASLPAKYQRTATKAAITTLANDLVKANLTANGVLSTEMVAAAAKGAYHVAGYGLGHEPNNWFSSAIAEQRKKWRMREEQLMKNKDWEGLAMHRFLTLFVNSIVIKFAGGATNWIWLRFQEAGLGLVTGALGKWNREPDWEDKRNLKQSIQDVHLARHKIARAMTGISVAMMAYAVYFLLQGDSDDEEKEIKRLTDLINSFKDLSKAEIMRKLREEHGITGLTGDNVTEKKNELLDEWEAKLADVEARSSFFKRVKSDWMLKRGFTKLAPDAMLIHYFLNTEKEPLNAAIRYTQQTTGIASPYSADEKISTAQELIRRGDHEGAMGALTSIVGSSFGVPMYRSSKDWVKLFKWMGGEEVSSDFRPPESFMDGLLGGGMLEDIGLWDPKIRITVLPGVGAVSYLRFKEQGISTMEDLYKTPEWWKMEYTDTEGKKKPILGAEAQRKARNWAEDYFKENPPKE